MFVRGESITIATIKSVRTFLPAICLSLALSNTTSGAIVDSSRRFSRIVDTYAVYSPDGAQVAFESYRIGSQCDIYVMDSLARNVLRLTTNPGIDETPAWSPDGRKILFASDRDSSLDIFVMNADGSNQTNLTRSKASRDIHPFWSPDGSKIIFNSKSDSATCLNIFVMNADGSNVIGLRTDSTDNSYASWSPNGRQIVFRRAMDSINSDIFVMNDDGSGLRNLTSHPAFDGWPSWSPDGQTILFASDRTVSKNIFSIDLSGTNLTQLTLYGNGEEGADAPFYSPSSAIVLYNYCHDRNCEIVRLYLSPNRP